MPGNRDNLSDKICIFLDEASGCGVEEVRSLDDSWRRDMDVFGPFSSEILAGGRRFAVNREGPGFGGPVIAAARLGSAMDLAWELVREGVLPERGSVLAGEQTSGRGRMRRVWHSPAGNIHGALYLGHLPDRWRQAASLLAGACLAHALQVATGGLIAIKWPNDLVQAGRKVAGILVEDRREGIMLGVGVNLHHAPADGLLRRDAVLPAGTLQGGEGEGPLSLWVRALAPAMEALDDALRMDRAEWIRSIEPRMLWLGRDVSVVEDGRETVRGCFAGLSEDGGLVIQNSTGKQTLYSGSVLVL